MASDLNLANRIWNATQKYAEEMGHSKEDVQYYTAVMVVAMLLDSLEDELVQELLGSRKEAN